MPCFGGNRPKTQQKAGDAGSPAFCSFGTFSCYTLGDCAQLNSLGDTPVYRLNTLAKYCVLVKPKRLAVSVTLK